jgi:hypothetical protein
MRASAHSKPETGEAPTYQEIKYEALEFLVINLIMAAKPP